ncbi:unnamed protein product, partial [Amoebophrya sp. A120]|eukprot:GSA120T00026397001.1
MRGSIMHHGMMLWGWSWGIFYGIFCALHLAAFSLPKCDAWGFWSQPSQAFAHCNLPTSCVWRGEKSCRRYGSWGRSE